MALVTTVMLLFAVMILVLTGAQLISTSFKETKYQQNVYGEAENIAKAGLIDTISWFRRQVPQPVRSGVPPAFDPGKDNWIDGAFQPTIESKSTIDGNIGLVKEYQLSENGTKWARYEVRRQTGTISGNPAPYDPFAVHDITAQRVQGKENGEGLVWSIVSTGYVWHKLSPLNVNEHYTPDKMISKIKVSTEIRRIDLNLANCACIVQDSGSGGTFNINIYKNGRLSRGNNPANSACGKFIGTNSPNNSGGELSGTTQTILANPNVEFVFGMSTTTLESFAAHTANDVTDLPYTSDGKLPEMTFMFIDGNANFDTAHPLDSSGILFVKGNLSIAESPNNRYSGLIYVTGTSTIYSQTSITGCIVAYKGLVLSNPSGLSPDVSEITYDETILDSVKEQICGYHENKSATHTYKLE